MADIMNSAGLGGFAGSVANGQGMAAPEQPSATSSGTPLMNIITYLLFLQCGLILVLTLPIYVPYRKETMEFLHYSPSLWKFRVVLLSMTGFLGILTVDTYLRLNRVNAQITGIQATQSAQANAAAGGMGVPPPAAGGVPPASSSSGLMELFGSRFRAQRDFYILSFNLFASLVLYQMHLLLMRVDRYKTQRNDARKARIETKREVKTAAENGQGVVSQTLNNTMNTVSQTFTDVVDTISSKVGTAQPVKEQVIASKKINDLNGNVEHRKTFVVEE